VDGQPPPRLIVAHQPTWGLDIGAVAFVQQQLLAARDAGAAVLLISDDLDEVMALGDRIAVMHGGTSHRSPAPRRLEPRTIGLAMAGPMNPGARRPMRLEKRPALRAALLAAPLAAVAFTLLISGAGGLGRCAGGHHLGPAAEGGFGSLFAWSETLTRAVPLILTGLAAAVAFRPGCSTSAPKASSTRRVAAVAVGGLHGGTGFALPTWCCSR
jgi:energy-coupling factor transporter ATP-binding protein EcfA2